MASPTGFVFLRTGGGLQQRGDAPPVLMHQGQRPVLTEQGAAFVRLWSAGCHIGTMAAATSVAMVATLTSRRFAGRSGQGYIARGQLVQSSPATPSKCDLSSGPPRQRGGRERVVLCAGSTSAVSGPSPLGNREGEADGVRIVVLELLLPATAIGILASQLLGPMAFAIRSVLVPTTLDIIKDDMTQFTQNAFSVLGLLFALLLGDTFAVMLQRQQRMYEAVYREIAEAQALIEQLELICSNRLVGGPGDGETAQSEIVRPLLADVQAYLEKDVCRLGEPRLLPGTRAGSGSSVGLGATVDPLEGLLFATSVGLPSSVCDSIMNLRQARSDRLAASQRRFPIGHYAILALFAILVLGTFVLLSAGTANFEPVPELSTQPGQLLWLQAPLFGLLCGAVALAALVLRELADPGDISSRQKLFGVQTVSQEALRGLAEELSGRRDSYESRT